MPKLDWRTAASVGLVLLTAFGVAGYILGFQLGEQAGEKNAHTQEYARHAAEEIERACRSMDVVAQHKCFVRVIETTHEDQRAQGDLNAQRDMARWALFMLMATVVMAGFTAWGVYWVWQTLLETRRIGEAQTRAYINFDFGPPSHTESTDGTIKFSNDLKIRNSGQTPAYNVWAKFWITSIPALDEKFTLNPTDHTIRESTKGSSVVDSGQKGSGIEIHETFQAAEWAKIMSRERHLVFGIQIHYTDVFCNDLKMPSQVGRYDMEGNRVYWARQKESQDL